MTALQKLLLSSDNGGQIHDADLWTPQSDLAIAQGLAEEVKYRDSYTWIRLTAAGRAAKAKLKTS